MASTFHPSSNSAFMAPLQPPSSPPQPSDVPISSARVRLSYEYDSFEDGPSPRYLEVQQQQQQQEVPHQPASVGTNANNESTNVTHEYGWLQNIDDEVRRRHEELTRVREASKASVHLLENKARSGLSPAFSPSVQHFVSNVMARGTATSLFPGGSLSGRIPSGPDDERTPTTPGGGDLLQTPRTAVGALNASSSFRTKGALGFIKDEAVRLRVDLEQQAGMLASEKQYNDQLQDEVRKLVGEVERLRQESEVQLDQLRQELAHKHQEYEELKEFSKQAQATGLDTETRLQAIIEEMQLMPITGLEQHQQQQDEETDAAAQAQATLVYQEEQLLILNRQLEELRQRGATAEETARAATQALEELQQQRETTDAYLIEAQQLRWKCEQQQIEQQQQQEEATAAEAAETAVGVMIPPALSPTTPLFGSGVDVEGLTQALAVSESAKEALEEELRQQQQDAEWYRAEIERLQQQEEQSQDEGQGVIAPPETGQRGEEEAGARRALEEQLHQQRQELEWCRAEIEQLQQSQVEGQSATMAAGGGQGGDEEAAARQALEEALHQQQDVATWLQEEVEQLRRERDERQAAAAASAYASQEEEGGGMVQMLEGEIQRQRELLRSYKAELEQHRQEKTATTAGMTTTLDITAPLTAPVVGQEQGGTEGQMVSLQPVEDEERQTLESTIQALEEANRQLVEGFQMVEGKLARVNELETEKRDLLLLVDELKDVLGNERENHHRHLENTLSGLKYEVERLVDEVHRLEAADKELRLKKYNESLFVLKRVTHNVLAKQQLKTKQRAICRWVTAVNAMQGEELVAIREQAAKQAPQAEELEQLECENKALLEELQREPPTRGGVMAGVVQGGTSASGGSGVASFLSSLFKCFFVGSLLMFLQQHFAMLGGVSSYCYMETARITM